MPPDFRSDPMQSPEGAGRARRAWDAYASAVNKHVTPRVPAIVGLARKVAVPVTFDLLGFWLTWQLEGGFEGLQRMGMSRSAIYRRIKVFRELTGMHPDEYEVDGVSLDVAAYHGFPGKPAR